jgi:SAM-dependent methyltransferase
VTDNGHVQPDSSRIHGILTAYLQSKAVFVTLELGIFDILDKEPYTAADLAGQMGIEQRPVRALLFALQGLQLVSREGERYQNTAEASRYLVSGKPEYMGGFAEHQDQHFGNFAKLIDAVRENRSITQRVLKEGYSNQGAAAGEGREGTGRLIQAMQVSSRLQAAQLARSAEMSHITHLLDLGCGSGAYSAALARQYPGLRITAMDYPAVCELASHVIAEAGVSGTVEVRPADIMRDPWPQSDAILLSHVLDGYGSQAEKVIEKAYTALPTGGQLFVHGHMPSLATGLFPFLFGLILLGNTEEGEVHDADDVALWMRRAGFHDVQTSNVSVLSGLITGIK